MIGPVRPTIFGMNKHRFSQVTLGIVILTLGKLIFAPAGSRRYTQPVFSHTLTVQPNCPDTTKQHCGEIQLIAVDKTTASTALSDDWTTAAAPSDIENPANALEYEFSVAEQRYRADQLTVTLHYIVNTSGDPYPLFDKHNISIPDDPALFTEQTSQQGTYRIFQADETLHLISCLNPNGPATVTLEQFSHRRQRYDLHWQRLAPWLLGQTRLFDHRCLWIDIAMPAAGQPLDSAAVTLEPLWLALSQQLQTTFPGP